MHKIQIKKLDAHKELIEKSKTRPCDSNNCKAKTKEELISTSVKESAPTNENETFIVLILRITLKMISKRLYDTYVDGATCIVLN